MRVEFRRRGKSLGEDRRRQIERRLSDAMSRFSGLVQRVVVRVEAPDGPEGALNERCHIQARLSGRRTIVAEVRDVSLEPAVTRATVRLMRRLREALLRLRENRQPMPARRDPDVIWVSETGV